MNLRASWTRIFKDIRTLNHLDVYVISIAAISFAILGLFPNVVSDDVRTAIMLAALGLLVFNISVPKTRASDIDELLNDRAAFPPFNERLKGTRKLWIYAPSAANILNGDNMESIRKEILAHPDGELRVIVQNPANTEAVNILTYQLDESVDFPVQRLTTELSNSLARFDQVKSWKREGRFNGTFDYHLLDYSPGFSLVILNPDKSNGSVIVEMHGYHNESTVSRMNIEIKKQESERWFTYWVSQFDHMWTESKEAKS